MTIPFPLLLNNLRNVFDLASIYEIFPSNQDLHNDTHANN